MSRPTREWVPGGLAVTAVTVGVALREVGFDPLAGGRLAALVWGLWVLQISIGAVRAAFRVTARATAAAVDAETALAAEREVAAVVRADRRHRFRLLQDSTLPLVRGIAAGHLDPRSDDVRHRCAAEAAALRRTLAGSNSPAVLGDLHRVIEAARSRGVLVEVQAAGDLSRVPPAAREEIVRSVADVLDGLSSDRVLLTVLGSSDETRVFVSFPVPDCGRRQGPPVRPLADPRCSTQIVEDVGDGRAVLEVIWSR